MLKRSAWLASSLCALSLALSSCESEQQTVAPKAPPFVFRSLELRQKQPTGERDWDLTSPEARYEFTRRLVRAKTPVGVLYRNNKPAYRISALRATVINDGVVVLLEGDVKIQQLLGQKVLMKGDRLRWTPADALLVMEQRPEAIDRRTRIKSTRAQFNQRSQDLTMFGTVQLERWRTQEGLKQGKHAESVVRAHQTLWNLGSGVLKAKGPVLGQHRGPAHKILHQLHASRLEGNTLQGFLDLIAPVKVLAPVQKGRLDASTTRWLFNDDALVSDSPFTGSMKQSQLFGDAFRIAMGDSILNVPRGCRLEQPGDRLLARTCLWNWDTNAVTARGNVELTRTANKQITRSDHLDGTVGENGTVVFSSPGGRVYSELNIKDHQGVRSSEGGSRRSPVSF